MTTEGSSKIISRLLTLSFVGAIVLGAAWMVFAQNGSLFAS
jgi:Tfp pilus assembly protein PilZ